MSANIVLEEALIAWIRQVMSLSMRRFIGFATENKLKMSHIAVLFLLSGDARCAVTELGEEFGVSGAAASQMVEKLVQMGLVQRYEDANDRRIKRLKLTRKGKDIVNKSIEAREQWITSFAETFEAREAQETAHIFNALTERAAQFDIRDQS
jgi:DNA-binding MarR family transcriptional regulator